MKLNEFLSEEQLDEINLKKALGAGLIATAAAGTYSPFFPKYEKPPQSPERSVLQKAKPEVKDEAQILADKILSKYKINPDLALKVAQLAKKHEKIDFPKAEDILAVAGIESSFRPEAVSKLKKDPAMGLTQIRPGVHKLDSKRLGADIEHQIQKSAEILNQYNKQLKDQEAAIIAYNVGPGAYRKGDYTQNYITKFKKEKELYK